MRKSVAVAGGFCLLGLGYMLGALQVLGPGALFAQPGGAPKSGAVTVSDEAKEKIKAAHDALRAASDALVDEDKYASAIKGVNAFAVLTGGGNALRDLENGAVVDPETFAALHANLATDNVAVELGRDSEGRLTYKGRVIRMYTVSRLKALYSVRGEITGEELLPAANEEVSAQVQKGAGKK